MGNFTFEKCGGIEGLYLIHPKVFGDNRGYFMETYNYNAFKEAGLDMVFVQDNQSSSTKGVLEVFIIRRIIHRASWYVYLAERYLMWQWISAEVPKHTENGLALH